MDGWEGFGLGKVSCESPDFTTGVWGCGAFCFLVLSPLCFRVFQCPVAAALWWLVKVGFSPFWSSVLGSALVLPGRCGNFAVADGLGGDATVRVTWLGLTWEDRGNPGDIEEGMDGGGDGSLRLLRADKKVGG